MKQSSRDRFWRVTAAAVVLTGLARTGARADPAPSIAALALQSRWTVGGVSTTGMVTLSAPAPAAGVVVTLASNHPAAQVPPAVILPSSARQAIFDVTTTPVAKSTTVTLSATAGGTTRSATLQIFAPSLASFSLMPQTPTGGQSVTATLMLEGAAPAGGITLPLAASPPGLISLPAQVAFPEGARQATFTIRTPVVTADTSVDLTAGTSSAPRTTTLDLLSAPPAVGPGSVYALSLATHNMVYDPLRRLIYASLDAPPGGTEGIAVVDPFQGVVTATVPTPREVYGLALSDDSQYLYAIPVGDGRSINVLRMKLPSFETDLQFIIPPDPTFTTFLDQMEVLPGHPRSLALLTSLYSLPGEAHVSIYDDDQLRPLVATLPGDNYTMQFGDSAARLYTYGVRSSYLRGDAGPALQRMSVSADGISPDGITFNVIDGLGTGMRYQAGRLYTTSGRIVDPEAGLLLGRFPALLDVGDLPGSPDYSTNLVRPDVDAGRVYYLVGEGPDRKLRAYDAATFQLLGEQVVPNVDTSEGELLRWGDDGLMFRTSTKLFLIRLALRPPADLLLVEPRTVVSGRPATGTIYLAAPAPAGGTMVSLSSSDPAAVVPRMLVVPAGATQASFPILTGPVEMPTDVVIILYLNGIRTDHLEVLPAQ